MYVVRETRKAISTRLVVFTFDTQKQILAIDGKQTKLTTKESELLGLLCAHAMRFCSVISH